MRNLAKRLALTRTVHTTQKNILKQQKTTFDFLVSSCSEFKKVAWRPKKYRTSNIFQLSELLFPKTCCPVGHTSQRSSYELVTNNKRNDCPRTIYQELMSQYLEHEIRPLPLVLPPGTVSLCRSPCSSRSPLVWGEICISIPGSPFDSVVFLANDSTFSSFHFPACLLEKQD